VKQTELIQLISAPHRSNYDDMQKLVELKEQFPFFQSAHMLLTLVSKKFDSGIYQDTLRKTAISIPNRARLYNLLNTPEVIEEEVVTEKQTTEIEHLKAIELHSGKKEPTEEELTKQVEKEVEKNIITSFVEKEILKTHDWYKPKEKKKEVKREEEKKEEINSGSFSDWLQALKKVDRMEGVAESKTEEVKEEEESRIITDFKKSDDKKAKEKAIIDRIIESDPGNIRLDPNQRFFEANQKAKESMLENEHLVTETLAKIYALQGNIPKAIRAYEILSLKFPQKNAYFASLIENLKKDNK